MTLKKSSAIDRYQRSIKRVSNKTSKIQESNETSLLKANQIHDDIEMAAKPDVSLDTGSNFSVNEEVSNLQLELKNLREEIKKLREENFKLKKKAKQIRNNRRIF